MLSEKVPSVPESAYLQCEQIARTHGRTFYFASRCLPLAQRRAILATYAWCRIADDIVDEAPGSGSKRSLETLEYWQAQLDSPTDPIALAFAEVRAQYDVPIQPVLDLLTGVRMDLETTRYANWSELHTYCYRVAGTVGLMVAPILGCRDDRALIHAAELGVGMQLTNILRDIGDDAKLGRLYLPLDEIESFGCDPEAILALRMEPKFRDLMQFQVSRARNLYLSARNGIPALDKYGRFTTLMAGDLYARILKEIELLDYDVFRTRAHCSTARKFFSVPGISMSFLRMSFARQPSRQPGLAIVPAGDRPELTIPIALRSEQLQTENRTYG